MADIKVEIDDTDLSVIRRAVGRVAGAPSLPPRKAGGNTVQSRARAERPRHLDGRRQEHVKNERQVPLNTDVSPEIKQLVLRAKVEFGMPMKLFVAKAIEHYFRVLELEAQSEAQSEAD